VVVIDGKTDKEPPCPSAPRLHSEASIGYLAPGGYANSVCRERDSRRDPDARVAVQVLLSQLSLEPGGERFAQTDGCESLAASRKPPHLLAVLDLAEPRAARVDARAHRSDRRARSEPLFARAQLLHGLAQ